MGLVADLEFADGTTQSVAVEWGWDAGIVDVPLPPGKGVPVSFGFHYELEPIIMEEDGPNWQSLRPPEPLPGCLRVKSSAMREIKGGTVSLLDLGAFYSGHAASSR